MLSLAEGLAGIGLLFIGIKLITAQMQQVMGRRLRHWLKAATRSPVISFFAGAVAGLVTQSSNAVAVIAANLVRGRALATRDAIPVVAGGNLGTTMVVFLAAIDIHLAILVVVGLVGLGFQFGLDKRATTRGWAQVLLGFALLFLGIDFLKGAPRHFDISQLADFMSGAPSLLAITAGLVVASVTQSSSMATILVLAALKGGFVDLEGCFFVVVGANLGSGLAMVIFSGALKGIGRQLCHVHVLVKAIGSAAALLAWLGAEALGGDPAALFLRIGHGDPAAAVSILFLALQLVGGLPVSLLRDPVARLAARISPPTIEDDVSRPSFVDRDAASDPAGALELSDAEIRALIGRLPDLLPDLDAEGRLDRKATQILARGSSMVAATTDAFVVDLIARGLSPGDLDEALGQQARIEMLHALIDTVTDFTSLIATFDRVPPLAFNLSESLRVIAMQFAETVVSGDRQDFDLLIELTSDRSEHLDRIRRSLAATALGAEDGARRLLLATSRFERAIWLIRRLAIALRPQDETEAALVESSP